MKTFCTNQKKAWYIIPFYFPISFKTLLTPLLILLFFSGGMAQAPMGGTLTGGPFSFCVGDGVADNLEAGAISLTGSTGANNQWLVTDGEGNILGLPPMPSAVDFDGAGVGACLVWNLSYEDSIVGLESGLNVNELQGNFSLSNSVTVNRSTPMGGTLTGGPFSFCVGDGVADNLAAGAISLTGSTGANNQWLITDSEGNILGLPPMPSAVDFDGAGVGACLVWHLSYADSLVGLEAGLNANDLQGCFSLSNPITVNRDAEGGACDTPDCDAVGGTLTGGPFSFCVGDGIADNLAAGSISLTGSTGANNQWLVTDSEGNILGLPPMPSAVDFDGAGVGACLVWHLSYADSLVGLEAGLNANDLQGCFDLSNPVTVNRDAEGGACDAGADACPIPSEATITFQSMTRLTLDWEEVDGAESYIIQARIKGSNQWAVTASLESSSARVRAVPDRDFEYRIKTVCADGESEYSPVYEFNTTGGLVGDTAESRSAEQSDVDLILTDVGMTKTVEVAPNPFTDGLQVKYEVATENTLLSIYHINGKKVYEQYLAVDNVVHTIEGTNLENGFYILSIQEEGQQAINLRIIKQNRF